MYIVFKMKSIMINSRFCLNREKSKLYFNFWRFLFHKFFCISKICIVYMHLISFHYYLFHLLKIVPYARVYKSSEIEIVNLGMLTFAESPGDHRSFIIDISTRSLPCPVLFDFQKGLKVLSSKIFRFIQPTLIKSPPLKLQIDY